jgi:hypothetical protein
MARDHLLELLRTRTHFDDGEKHEGFSPNQPRIMFPNLGDIERVLQLFESLARHSGEADIVAAIYKQTRDVAQVYEDHDALTSGEGGAFVVRFPVRHIEVPNRDAADGSRTRLPSSTRSPLRPAMT